MRRPSKSAHEITVADGPIGSCIHKFGSGQPHFGRTGGIARDPAPEDDIGGDEDLCGMSDRRDRFVRAGE